MHNRYSHSSMAFLLGFSLVAARPLPYEGNVAREEPDEVGLGENPKHRTVVVVFCMVYTFVLALAQGYRAGRMRDTKSRGRFPDALVFVQGFLSTAFVFAVGINSAGLGLATDSQCRAAILVCIAMYGAAKMALYLFLLERVHIIRAPFVDRLRDAVWVIGAVLTVGGFASIMAYEFVDPRHNLSRKDGVCRIGIQPNAGVAVIVLDVTINSVLTGIFIWQLRPAFHSIKCRSIVMPNQPVTQQGRRRSSLKALLGVKIQEQQTYREPRHVLRQNLQKVVIRNIIGSAVVLVNTVINNAIFLTWPFASQSHACQLMCLTDIVTGMLVINWLTMRSPDGELNSIRDFSSRNTDSVVTNSTLAPTRMLTMENGKNSGALTKEIQVQYACGES
ncbi:hypothetical protein B0J11DRAFT_430209 [Dendryphion nanum]|uniref:Uncharacterized protein n=1 Tax=Dendryphion nanum TaxID=256645 RepID=A0A9P9E258_9PLEO|nr:hypothetical protein B0J11DRAFT_430209 [Dendryphion nanum]